MENELGLMVAVVGSGITSEDSGVAVLHAMELYSDVKVLILAEKPLNEHITLKSNVIKAIPELYIPFIDRNKCSRATRQEYKHRMLSHGKRK